MPPLQKQEKGAVRVLHHQGQHRLGIPRHKEQIGVNAQRGALPQDGGVQAGVAGKLFLADPQVQRPGDVEALFPLCLPDEPGALGAAVVAQVHPKGGDVVVVGVGHHVLHQGVVGALGVLQHPLGVGNQPGLKAPRGELGPGVNQVPGLPLGGFLHCLQRPADGRLHQHAGHVAFHGSRMPHLSCLPPRAKSPGQISIV